MKVLSNTDNKPVIYKSHVIPPKGQILLDDKGEVIENFTDNSAEIEKLRKEVKEDNTKKSKNDDIRFEELEDEIRDFKKSFKFDKDSKTLEINL